MTPSGKFRLCSKMLYGPPIAANSGRMGGLAIRATFSAVEGLSRYGTPADDGDTETDEIAVKIESAGVSVEFISRGVDLRSKCGLTALRLLIMPASYDRMQMFSIATNTMRTCAVIGLMRIKAIVQAEGVILWLTVVVS